MFFIPNFHFETLTLPSVGVACPNTINGGRNGVSFAGIKKGKVCHVDMGKRQGWAMNVLKTVLNYIPPIPTHLLETFHGDDWIWVWSKFNGYRWVMDKGCEIYHHVGASALRLGFRRYKRMERDKWVKINLL